MNSAHFGPRVFNVKMRDFLPEIDTTEFVWSPGVQWCPWFARSVKFWPPLALSVRVWREREREKATGMGEAG